MIKEDVKEIRHVFPKVMTAAWADNIIRTKQPIIGYKAAFIEYKNGKLKPCIVKLSIPASALYTIYYREPYEKYGKHRCASAVVIGFLSYYTGKEIKVTKARSIFYNYFYYKLSDYIFPAYFSVSCSTCAGGIHYFNFLEAARCYMDNILYEIRREIKNRHMGSHVEPEDSEILRIMCNEQRKNVLPLFDITRVL